MVCLISVIDTIAVPFTLLAAAISLGAGSWRKKLYTLLLPLLTTTHIGGGPVQCGQLARNCNCGETTHLCWECALVRLCIKDGGEWDESPQYPLPQWLVTTKHPPQYELSLYS